MCLTVKHLWKGQQMSEITWVGWKGKIPTIVASEKECFKCIRVNFFCINGN